MSLPFHILFTKTKSIYDKDVTPWKNLGLSQGQPKILYFLMENEGCIQRDLADWCAIEPATVSKLLDAMESQELISRRTKPGDRRSLYIYLTPKGSAVAAQVGKCFQQVENRVLRDFSPEERKEFFSYLKRMQKTLLEDISKT